MKTPEESEFLNEILLSPPITFQPSKDFLEFLIFLGFVHGQMLVCLQTAEEISMGARVSRAEG